MCTVCVLCVYCVSVLCVYGECTVCVLCVYLFTLAYFGTICPGMDQVMMSQHHRLVALYVGYSPTPEESYH